MVMRKRSRAPAHPGEILHKEFLAPLKLNSYSLAEALLVPRDRIERLVRGRRSISADTALRLARFFGTTAEFWMGVQAHFDLETGRRNAKKDISAIRPLMHTLYFDHDEVEAESDPAR
jgi:addiction module HigA family antidote